MIYLPAPQDSDYSIILDQTKVSNNSFTPDDAQIGDRVKVYLHKDETLYEGEIHTLSKVGKFGPLIKVDITYDDGEEEECDWPDEDVIITKKKG